MKNTAKFFSVFAIILLYNCSCISQNTKKLSFNEDWQFVRLSNQAENEVKKERSKTQNAADWNSQFNIEYVETTGKNEDDSKLWKFEIEKELNSIKQLSWENATIPHTAYNEP